MTAEYTMTCCNPACNEPIYFEFVVVPQKGGDRYLHKECVPS